MQVYSVNSVVRLADSANQSVSRFVEVRKSKEEGGRAAVWQVSTHSQSMVRLPSGLCRLTLQMKLEKEPPCYSSTQQYGTEQ